MDRWYGKVAIVTGASSGIGEVIAKTLVKKGLKVVGLARRLDNMEKLKDELQNEEGIFFAKQCDVSNEEDIIAAFDWIKEELGGVDILVNNAATVGFDMILNTTTEYYKRIIDVNFIAPAIFMRESVKIMKANNVAGHIINLNSIAGKAVPSGDIICNMYSPTKFALTAMTEVIEIELQLIQTAIKITSLHPGLVKTDLPPPDLLDKVPYVYPEDIAESVIYILSTPSHVQIKDLTITPVPGFQRE